MPLTSPWAFQASCRKNNPVKQQNLQHGLTIKLNPDPFTGVYGDDTELCSNTYPLLSASRWEDVCCTSCAASSTSYERNTTLQTSVPLSEILIIKRYPHLDSKGCWGWSSKQTHGIPRNGDITSTYGMQTWTEQLFSVVKALPASQEEPELQTQMRGTACPWERKGNNKNWERAIP